VILGSWNGQIPGEGLRQGLLKPRGMSHTLEESGVLGTHSTVSRASRVVSSSN
jgi:hypothetical protein